MDDPSSLVSPKAEPAATQVSVEQVSASNVTFSHALQTIQEPDVCRHPIAGCSTLLTAPAFRETFSLQRNAEMYIPFEI